MLIYDCVYRGLSCLFIHEGASPHGQHSPQVGVSGYIKMTGKREPISKTKRERTGTVLPQPASMFLPRITALTSLREGV